MFNHSYYEYDYTAKISHKAALKAGAYLYRITSLSHNQLVHTLSGGATLKRRSFGRFNGPQQQISYCANNVLVCLAEVLFHMYRTVLDKIEARQPADEIVACVEQDRCLVIVRVDEIRDLVYLDAKGVTIDYDPRICGATVVFPDPHYRVFWDFSNQLRVSDKKGLLYPSARHSKDLCIALFDDETKRILSGSYMVLQVKLRLLPEDQELADPPMVCDPFSEKIHPTMGYYKFEDPLELSQAKTVGAIHPSDLPANGKVDFVRRQYKTYPADAICEP